MFFAVLLKACLLLCISGVWSSPIKGNLALQVRSNGGSPISLNNWGGFSSLDGFDNFYGVDNFDGSRNVQVIIIEEQEVICRSQRVEIIQQQLVILQEMAKRIITEQICEVETQTIVFEQFSSSMHDFNNDLNRRNGRAPGYDANIAGHMANLLDSNGNLNGVDLGFTGTDVGKNTVTPSGSNWNDGSSPSSVGGAEQIAKAARNATQVSNLS